MSTYRLEAINQCLDAIGETHVNTINSGVPDAEAASQMVDRSCRQVLSAGWHCNSVFGVSLTPDEDSEVQIGQDVLRIDTSGPDFGTPITTRRDTDGLTKLFKVKDQSYKFTGPVTVDIVYFFDIDGLPFPLQNYIAAKAASMFQTSEMGSASLNQFTTSAEEEAWQMLLDYEDSQEDSNILRDSWYMREVTGRNR